MSFPANSISVKPILQVSQITQIAQDLNIHTFQGVAAFEGSFVVPTLDGTLLRIRNEGEISPWITFCKGFE